MSGQPLAGRRILVTRPRELAEGLAAAIRGAGGDAIVVPAIEIRDLEDRSAFAAVAARLERFDWAIFVSPMAVRKAFMLLAAERPGAAWPERLRVAAIGRGSERALRAEGIPAIVPPGTADSEALLAMAEFSDVAGQRIVIFRGRGGRELLAETLKARGAQVEYAECYVRVRPDPGPGAAALRSGEVSIDALTVSSAEGFANLIEMAGEPARARLLRTPVFVPHRRVAERAKSLGASIVRVAGPADAEMLAALVAYFGGTHS